MAIKLRGNSGAQGNNNRQQPQAASEYTVPNVTSSNSLPANFTRYIGYDNAQAFESQLIAFYAKIKNNGCFFDKPIPNPASPEVNKISSTVNIPVEFDLVSIKTIITGLSSAKLLDLSKIGSGKSPELAAEAFNTVISEVKATANTANAVKNTFIKLICWCIRYSTYSIKNIMYIGEISKHEVYWLYLLSLLGCSVIYVNYTDENSYLETDKESKYSTLVKGSIFAPLSINLGKVNIAAYEQAEKAKEQENKAREQLNAIMNQTTSVMLKYLPTDKESFSKDILTTAELRRAKLMCTDTTVPLYFTAYIGYDDEIMYKNMLFSLKEELTAKNKQFQIIENLSKPSYQDAAEYYSIQKTNDSTMINAFASRISIKDNYGRTVLAQKALIDTLKNINTNNLYNTAVQLSVWLKKFTSSVDFFQSDFPIIIYFGNITSLELSLMSILSRTGFDVIYFSPDKSVLPLLHQSDLFDMQIIECSESQSGMTFPDKLIKTKMATTAFNAERSLDNILYSDNTMFRNYQFSMSRNQTLRTTYEELGIMWHQQSMFRTGFDSKNNYVIVPNLFAKINGVHKDDIQAYYKEIAFKLSPMSVYYKTVPFFKPIMSNDNYAPFYNGMKIDIEALKRSQYNKYDYMNDSVQYLILHKMQEVIDSGFIDVPPGDLIPLVIKTGLNIPNKLLQILQKFDFTKDIPKIVIVSSGKKTFAVFECILLVLFNMIGFDIIIYTPTGYKNIESFVRPEAFEAFNLGDFKYDFVPQSLKTPKEIPQEKSSIFDRIFKGKK